MGSNPKRVPKEDGAWWSKDDEKEDYDEKMEVECLSSGLKRGDKQYMRYPWNRTLIIKLLGRNIGYNVLHRKIHELWRPKATIDLLAIANGFFMARFSF